MSILYLIRNYVLSELQKTCGHPDHKVTADINEGDSTPLHWCMICGAYRFEGNKDWTTPHPKWRD